MTVDDKVTLPQIGEPDKIEIFPGLIFEDKLRIKTQRRLEKQYGLPMLRIFPGKMNKPDPENEGGFITEEWKGVDFEFLDNLIPLITILGMQVDGSVTQEKIEVFFDDLPLPLAEVTKNLCDYFERVKEKAVGVKEEEKNA